MIGRLRRQPLFMIGFLFVFLLVAASIGYSLIFGNEAPKSPLVYFDNHANVTSTTPYSPADVFPLGTDNQGRNYGVLLLMGAKYTIGVALLIAFIRVMISLVLGGVYGQLFYRFKNFVTGISDGVHYLPITLFAYLLLMQVLIMDPLTESFEYSYAARMTFEIVILAIIAVPIVTVLIGNEIGEIQKRDFIVSAKVLGGSRLHILYRHILPNLLPRFIYIFLQQTIQILIILLHLGIFQLFLGGRAVVGHRPPDIFSITNEWSGLIGQFYQKIHSQLWLLFGPLVLLTVTIIMFSFMAEGLKTAFKGHGGIQKRPKIKHTEIEKTLDQNALFLPVRQKTGMLDGD